METPAALAKVINWPKTLIDFTFDGLYSNPYHWDLNTMQNLLASHQDSLKTLKIGSMHSTNNIMFDFSVFNNLEKLHVSAWTSSQQPEFRPSRFLPPKLHTFTWDFTIEDQHSEGLGSFGQPEADWLSHFVNVATREQRALRQIHIIFTPEIFIWSFNYRAFENLRYPWDWMDEVRDKIRPHAINLTYNTPVLTKAQYIETIECARIQAEEEANHSSLVPTGAD
jgi:hypothetical protein